ncbi:MAG: conjugal transfer protein TraX [Lachnospiraceae bacterium]|nr:conjugal transfer protein TraX [Lachnospiraceae bacterium]
MLIQRFERHNNNFDLKAKEKHDFKADKKRNTTSTIKAIALITMTFDHIPAVILEPLMAYKSAVLPTGISYVINAFEIIFRFLGRIAFPLFLFMMVEGFFFTHDRKKYALRLLLFALISEPIFDLAVSYTGLGIDGLHIWDPKIQNIYFTLLLGFLSICCIHILLDKFEERGISPLDIKIKDRRMQSLKPILVIIAISLIASLIAFFIKCDYSFRGVLPLITGYLFHRYKATAKQVFLAILITICIFNFLELVGFLTLPFIQTYKGKPGRKLNKWFFYIYYPAHLGVLCLIRLLLSRII